MVRVEAVSDVYTLTSQSQVCDLRRREKLVPLLVVMENTVERSKLWRRPLPPTGMRLLLAEGRANHGADCNDQDGDQILYQLYYPSHWREVFEAVAIDCACFVEDLAGFGWALSR